MTLPPITAPMQPLQPNAPRPMFSALAIASSVRARSGFLITGPCAQKIAAASGLLASSFHATLRQWASRAVTGKPSRA